MNSRFHKRQAEELIKQVNSGCMYPERKIALAQVHATLATILDGDDS